VRLLRLSSALATPVFEKGEAMNHHEADGRVLPVQSARQALRIGRLDHKPESRPSIVEPDAVSWLAWIDESHAGGLRPGNVNNDIARRAVDFYARRGLVIEVGTKVTPAFVSKCIDALEAAGVESDLITDLRRHYGASPRHDAPLRRGPEARHSEVPVEPHGLGKMPAEAAQTVERRPVEQARLGSLTAVDSLLAEVIGYVPVHLQGQPGALLYSGRDALTEPAPIYLMGVNPGGDPRIEPQTVIEHATKVLTAEARDFSAYRDERWGGGTMAPGTHKMQRNVLHLMRHLKVDPGKVPASNLVFVRSSREADIAGPQMKRMAEECWHLHEALLGRLRTRVVVCFGRTAADFVRGKIGAHIQTGEFVEQNNRRWVSRSYRNDDGMVVVQVTHPSIASWRNPATDVSPLVAHAVGQAL